MGGRYWNMKIEPLTTRTRIENFSPKPYFSNCLGTIISRIVPVFKGQDLNNINIVTFDKSKSEAIVVFKGRALRTVIDRSPSIEGNSEHCPLAHFIHWNYQKRRAPKIPNITEFLIAKDADYLDMRNDILNIRETFNNLKVSMFRSTFSRREKVVILIPESTDDALGLKMCSQYSLDYYKIK